MQPTTISDRDMEAQCNLAAAQKALAEILAENKRQNWPGIDRSELGIAIRRRAMNWAIGNQELEGYAPPEEGSFFAELVEHKIRGNITSAQTKYLNNVLLGIE